MALDWFSEAKIVSNLKMDKKKSCGVRFLSQKMNSARLTSNKTKNFSDLPSLHTTTTPTTHSPYKNGFQNA